MKKPKKLYLSDDEMITTLRLAMSVQDQSGEQMMEVLKYVEHLNLGATLFELIMEGCVAVFHDGSEIQVKTLEPYVGMKVRDMLDNHKYKGKNER